MYKEDKSHELKIPVLMESEGNFDISKLDYTPLNVNVLKIDSDEFKMYIKNNSIKDDGNVFLNIITDHLNIC